MHDMKYITIKQALLKDPQNSSLRQQFLEHVKLSRRSPAPRCAYCDLSQFMKPGQIDSFFQEKDGKTYYVDAFRCDICGYLTIKADNEFVAQEPPAESEEEQ